MAKSETFVKGMKVRLSEQGQQSLINARNPDRLATVVGFNRDRTCVRVVFDGNKGNRTIHRKFLEPLPVPPSP